MPDAFFDVVAPQLSEAELRVALYIIRRTFGFKKDSDTISLRQMVEGITTKDGRSPRSWHRPEEVGGRQRPQRPRAQRGHPLAAQPSRERGNEPTTYALISSITPCPSRWTRGCPSTTDKPLSVPVDTQYTEDNKQNDNTQKNNKQKCPRVVSKDRDYT